jgi:hypothetical protein
MLGWVLHLQSCCDGEAAEEVWLISVCRVLCCRQQLEEARAQLLVEGAAREQLEEDMRRAFMRGEQRWGGCTV